jgi:hypothetical protein
MGRERDHRAVHRWTTKALSAGEFPTMVLPAGVKAVAMWRSKRFGSVLFHIEGSSELASFAIPCLEHFDARLDRMRRWMVIGGGGMGLHEPFEEALAHPPLGLFELGGGFGDQIRITVGYAGPHVAAIRLANDQRTWLSPIGVDGFFILGKTPDEPATTAIAVDSDGETLPGSLIAL